MAGTERLASHSVLASSTLYSTTQETLLTLSSHAQGPLAISKPWDPNWGAGSPSVSSTRPSSHRSTPLTTDGHWFPVFWFVFQFCNNVKVKNRCRNSTLNLILFTWQWFASGLLSECSNVTTAVPSQKHAGKQLRPHQRCWTRMVGSSGQSMCLTLFSTNDGHQEFLFPLFSSFPCL